MFENTEPSKEEILKAIEALEKNKILRLLIDLGTWIAGASVTGSVLYSIEIVVFFGLIAIELPILLVFVGAFLGGTALFGLKRMIFDGTFRSGQNAERVRNLKEKLKDFAAKQRASKVNNEDLEKFIVYFKKAVKLDRITPKKAQKLMVAVMKGKMEIQEAIKLLENLLD